jgi:hypothetical protein
MSQERYSEDKLAVQIGIPRKELRDVRRASMVEGVDWEKIGGEIMLTLTGLHRLRDFFDFDLVTVHAIAGEPIKNGRITLTVVEIPMNPKTVLADDALGRRYVVDVGRNATFCREDKIEAGPHETQGDLLKLLSPIPRDKRRAGIPEHPI